MEKSASFHVTDKQLNMAERIIPSLSESLDVKRFWEDQEVAISDPWSDTCPQMPIGIGMSNECVFTELDVEEDWYRLVHDNDFRVGLERSYNDKTEIAVGKRLLGEKSRNPDRAWPPVKKLNDIFEAENRWIKWSYWLLPAANNPAELEALLDRVELRLENLAAFILPKNWDREKERLTGLGESVPLYRNQRGPVTFAMSVYGLENLIFLISDLPDLAARFRDLICRSILEIARMLDSEAGFGAENAPRGFSWADDNCCMLSPEMYEFFGYPIVKAVFDRYSPDKNDLRSQHSDSDMEHLLPILSKLDLNSVNFGPSLSVAAIRQHLPGALIRGQLAPFTFSRNEEVYIVAETLRDFEMSRQDKGILFSTAGSINNGSRLTGLRLIMATIQNYCRYQ